MSQGHSIRLWSPAPSFERCIFFLDVRHRNMTAIVFIEIQSVRGRQQIGWMFIFWWIRLSITCWHECSAKNTSPGSKWHPNAWMNEINGENVINSRLLFYFLKTENQNVKGEIYAHTVWRVRREERTKHMFRYDNVSIDRHIVNLFWIYHLQSFVASLVLRAIFAPHTSTYVPIYTLRNVLLTKWWRRRRTFVRIYDFCDVADISSSASQAQNAQNGEWCVVWRIGTAVPYLLSS